MPRASRPDSGRERERSHIMLSIREVSGYGERGLRERADEEEEGIGSGAKCGVSVSLTVLVDA